MHKTTLILAGAAILSMATAQAVQFRDYDLFQTSLGQGNYTPFQFKGDFNIATGDGGSGDLWGYSKTTHTITGATLNFGTTTLGWGAKYSVDLADLGFLNSLDFSQSISVNWSYNIADNTFKLTAPLIADLAKDGILPYAIIQVPGFFTVNYAELLVTAVPKTSSPGTRVPDTASTMALFGGAMLAFSALRGKFRS